MRQQKVYPAGNRRFSFGAFTLIEILVVIAIVALISSVVLVSMQGTREKGRIAQCQQQVNGGLVGYWSFNEGTGSVVSDSSINLNEGSWQGTGSHWTDGKVGKAGQFNGSDDYVNVGQVLTGTSAFTAEAWIKWDGLGVWSDFLAEGCSGFTVTVNSGNLLFGKNCGPSWGLSGPVTAGQWYHIVMVYDGSSNYLYKNGGKYNGNNTLAFSHENLYIGQGHAYTDGEFFGGLIDEVRIYNRALSSSEIKCHYELKHFGG